MPLDADDALVPPPSLITEPDAPATDNSGPAPSSETPGPVEEPLRQSGEQEPSEEDATVTPPEFDPRHREPFLGLLYVGHLEEEVELFGHTFLLATPSRAEKIQMGLVIKPYQDTVASDLAYQSAMVAAYLLKVDGEELPEPVLTKAKDTAFGERFKWVIENVRDVVIDELFTKCFELNGKVQSAVDAMGKASG